MLLQGLFYYSYPHSHLLSVFIIHLFLCIVKRFYIFFTNKKHAPIPDVCFLRKGGSSLNFPLP
nr:MAG TPA: hypothetical protein [Caudoviricetes sp.]